MGNKSAKDLAFEKERAKYRKKIRELELELSKNAIEKRELMDRIAEIERERDELQNWVDRLLEYTEMSEHDMKRILQKEKYLAAASENMQKLFDVYEKLSGMDMLSDY